MTKVRASYLNALFHPNQLKKVIDKLCEVITESGVEFDTIVFRGSSGAMVSPLIAMKLKKELLLVRKNDNNHSFREMEGYVASNKFIIIDDLISTGGTMNEIFRVIRNSCDIDNIREAKCSGIFLYHSSLELKSEHQVNYILKKYDGPDEEKSETVPVYAFYDETLK